MGRPIQYRVQLTEEHETALTQLSTVGKSSARMIRRAQTLLMAHRGMEDQEIERALNISLCTVKPTRKRCAQHGLKAALSDASRSGRPQKFDGKDRAAITSLACTEAPEGHTQWSVRLIADTAVELQLVDGIAPSTVFYILNKTNSSRTESGTGVLPN
ncbi:helix-turn-helix domain-containing protein [Deinococcus sp. Arct2-2]|uniref:helix-turn-helix domain-containing protein n=1 Tax=Deinococcus sp. Arct2-2 TaxID=2568653 RepID=UPI0010A447D1|nr:helix-turn-helix domain-containing protein [Deinococcus sp. Arct2-2]THF68607.1 helix-turn-helix domain-containing protein [Deinococcus sp. Arct2-2]